MKFCTKDIRDEHTASLVLHAGGWITAWRVTRWGGLYPTRQRVGSTSKPHRLKRLIAKAAQGAYWMPAEDYVEFTVQETKRHPEIPMEDFLESMKVKR